MEEPTDSVPPQEGDIPTGNAHNDEFDDVIYNGKDKVFRGYEDSRIYKKIVDSKEKECLNKGTRFICAERYLLNLKTELNTLLNQ